MRLRQSKPVPLASMRVSVVWDSAQENCQTEVIVTLLERSGYDTGVDFWKLLDISKDLVTPKMKVLQGLDQFDVAGGRTGFHMSMVSMFEEVAEQHGIDVRRLMAAVGEVDVMRPPDELVLEQARKLSQLDR